MIYISLSLFLFTRISFECMYGYYCLTFCLMTNTHSYIPLTISLSLFGISIIIKEIPNGIIIPLVCKNICERLDSKMQVGKSNYLVGKKYCRKCEVYLYHDGVFCPCCKSQLRTTPHNKKE